MIQEKLEVIRDTPENVAKIKDKFNYRNKWSYLKEVKRGVFVDFAREEYENNKNKYDKLYYEIMQLNNCVSNNINVKKQQINIAKVIYDGLLADNDTINNEIIMYSGGQRQKASGERLIGSYNLSILILFVIYPHIFSWDNIVTFFKLEQCTILDDIEIPLMLIWNNQIDDKTQEFDEVIQGCGCSNFEVSVIRSINRYLYQIFTVRTQNKNYIWKKYENNMDKDINLILKDGNIEKYKGHTCLTATFSTSVYNQILNNYNPMFDGASTYFYIRYDGYITKVPLYYILETRCSQKKIYLPLNFYVDGLWSRIEEEMEK